MVPHVIATGIPSGFLSGITPAFSSEVPPRICIGIPTDFYKDSFQGLLQKLLDEFIIKFLQGFL